MIPEVRTDRPDVSWSPVREALELAGAVLVHGGEGGWETPDAAAGGLLSPREAERYRAIRHPVARRRHLASRALLKHAAGAVLGVPPRALELGREPGGRPLLCGVPGLSVSLTHTRGLLAVALSRVGPVGADAERAARVIEGTGLERRMCTSAERAALAELPGERRNERLVTLWTLKEAYGKALGLGMRLPFSTAGFAMAPGGVPRREAGGAAPRDPAWEFTTARPAGGHVLSTALCRTAGGAG
ncbi:4'-phosphopantetheinyl transferase superfamily protein [Streptomyces sp. NPDC002825]|uniref:4'-phosphopantetheinyl transferase family protein n=1 Tax=Streptomyces sp. NPDC002825 TaxID=3154666 RepID=UPI00333017ED